MSELDLNFFGSLIPVEMFSGGVAARIEVNLPQHPDRSVQTGSHFRFNPFTPQISSSLL